MNYTTNFNLRLPERNEQFNLDDWNNNTTSIDSAMQANKTNISNNATNITSILNGLSTVNTSDTNSVYYKLMKLIYPVGSLYWSSKSTNPGTLFGGTWVQIKDKFVLACGDTYTSVGATGGASSVTLSVSNMPSHNHSFTPSGTVSSHSHGLNGHTHSFTPSGKIGSTSGGTNNTTSKMSGNATGLFSIGLSGSNSSNNWCITKVSGNVSRSKTGNTFGTNDNYAAGGTQYDTVNINVSHTHTAYFTGDAGTTGGANGNTTSATPSFSGSAGTTGSSGSGTAFSILPPYVVKYCWERTA